MKDNSFLKIINLDTIDSTNSYAFRLAEEGAKEITVIRANSQTRGKGRMNKNWSSPKGGIYSSFIFKPPNSLEEITALPLIFSWGVAKLLTDIVKVKIKQPNDIMVGKKKISGVLVETRGNKKKVDFAIAGIGINVNTNEKKIYPSATSLYLETAVIHDIEKLFKELIKEIIGLYKEFKKGNIEKLLNEISYFCRKEITLQKFR